MRLLMDIDHVFAKSVIEFVLIDRIYRSRMDILVFEFERYDIIRKDKKELEDDRTKIDSFHACGILFQRSIFCIKQKKFRDNGKKLVISLSRIKNGYCRKKQNFIQKLLVIEKLDSQNAITIK